MSRLAPAKTALAFGLLIGLWHIAWSALVAAGLAKSFLDFVLRLHFLQFDYRIAPFSLPTAALLVMVTAAVGATFGLLLALIWNGVAGRITNPPGERS
jgi:hypothetical protein